MQHVIVVNWFVRRRVLAAILASFVASFYDYAYFHGSMNWLGISGSKKAASNHTPTALRRPSQYAATLAVDSSGLLPCFDDNNYLANVSDRELSPWL